MSSFEEARRAWPTIEVAEAVFTRYSSERPNAPPTRAGDLYLACACANGDSNAIAAFQASYFGEVDAAVRRLGAGLDVAEARQLVSARLFSPSASGRPRITTWTGVGDLRAWLRVVGTRIVYDVMRKQPRELPLMETLLEVPLATADPELRLMKERFRPQLRNALTQALSRLDARQRLLLTCELESRSQDDLAASYRVHVRTVQRWMREARETLLAELRSALALTVPTGEVDSILRLARSQFASAIAGLLKD